MCTHTPYFLYPSSCVCIINIFIHIYTCIAHVFFIHSSVCLSNTYLLFLAQSCLFATPWTAAHQASLLIAISLSLFKLMSTESVMPSNHLILCHPLLLLPSIFPSLRVFASESTLQIRWPEYWSFSFSISPSNKHSGLISFRIDWFYLLAVRGTLNSELSLAPQFKSINSSVFIFLYGPTLTSIHDYWKNHSFDYMDLC